MKPRWKKQSAQAAHVDDWLMTYADLITLLLCFFVILIINLAPKRNVPPPMPVATVQQDIQTLPTAPVQMPSRAIAGVLAGDLPFYDEEKIDDAEPETPKAIAAADATTANTLPEITAAIQQQVPAELKQQGDRITTLEINSAAFFDSGSAVLSSAGKHILQQVTGNLQSDAYKNYNITVEGHTDDTPIHTAMFPSNWELSTARASAVVQFFLSQGIPASRLRAAGYADTFPKVPNRDANGAPLPTNRAENRRVVIKLEKIEKQ